MGKKKSQKKQGTADNVRKHKKQAAQKTNPFEVKTNRQKHNVLGKKLTKFDKGRPGQSRDRANKKASSTPIVKISTDNIMNRIIVGSECQYGPNFLYIWY